MGGVEEWLLLGPTIKHTLYATLLQRDCQAEETNGFTHLLIRTNKLVNPCYGLQAAARLDSQVRT